MWKERKDKLRDDNGTCKGSGADESVVDDSGRKRPGWLRGKGSGLRLERKAGLFTNGLWPEGKIGLHPTRSNKLRSDGTGSWLLHGKRVWAQDRWWAQREVNGLGGFEWPMVQKWSEQGMQESSLWMVVSGTPVYGWWRPLLTLKKNTSPTGWFPFSSKTVKLWPGNFSPISLLPSFFSASFLSKITTIWVPNSSSAPRVAFQKPSREKPWSLLDKWGNWGPEELWR